MASTAQLTATPRDASNNALVNRVITWASSNTAVATVTNTGLVSAVAVGTCNIAATCEGKTSANVPVTVVNANTVASISLTPTSATVGVGTTLQLSATPEDSGGNPVSATVTWSSDTPADATVDANGLVTGVATGSANITAAVGAVNASCAITVPSTSITRLMWLMADSLTLTDASLVASWTDQANSPGIVASQTTNANKPTYHVNVQGGKPGVEFDATDYLTYSALDSVAWTRFWVASPNNTTAQAYFHYGPGSQIYTEPNGIFGIDIIKSDQTIMQYRTAAAAVTFNAFAVFELAYDGSAQTNLPTFKINGTAVPISLTAGAQNGTRKSEAGSTALGGHNSVNNLLGTVCEYVKMTSGTASTERARLGTKYGISVI